MRYYSCPHCERTTGYGYQRIPQEGLLVKCSQCNCYFTIYRDSPYGNVVVSRKFRQPEILVASGKSSQALKTQPAMFIPDHQVAGSCQRRRMVEA